MIVSRMMFELRILGGQTMKDRRRVEQSLADTIRKRYNVSMVMDRDDYPVNLTTLHLAQVNAQLAELDRVYEKILQMVLEMPDLELVKTEFEVLS